MASTPVFDVFDAFLARVNADDWVLPEELDLAAKDWIQFLNMAKFRFRYPRVKLDVVMEMVDGYETPFFLNEIGNDEIQVLATLMKHEWVKRCIASWEEIKMLYSNKDFSQANHLDKLIRYSDQVDLECIKALATYSRAVHGKPFDFTKWAGKVRL